MENGKWKIPQTGQVENGFNPLLRGVAWGVLLLLLCARTYAQETLPDVWSNKTIQDTVNNAYDSLAKHREVLDTLQHGLDTVITDIKTLDPLNVIWDAQYLDSLKNAYPAKAFIDSLLNYHQRIIALAQGKIDNVVRGVSLQNLYNAGTARKMLITNSSVAWQEIDPMKTVTAANTLPDYWGQIGKRDGAYYIGDHSLYDYWTRLKDDMYPFKVGQSGSKIDTLSSFIVDLVIEGNYDLTTKSYSIPVIQRNASGTWSIKLYSATGTPGTITLVAQFITTTNPEDSSQITVHDLSEVNGSGITGKIAVKWKELANGTNLSGYWGYPNGGYELRIDVFDNKSSPLHSQYVFFNPQLVLPDTIYIATGREFNLWYDQLVVDFNNNFYIKAVCDSGKDWNRSFRWTPSVADVKKTLTLYVYSQSGTNVGRVQTVLKTVSKTSGSGTINILTVGDSYISANTIVQELDTLIATDGGFTNDMIGTRGSGDDHHEGRGGWKYQYYATDYSDVTYGANPFWNGGIDFANYITTNSLPDPNIVIFHLGTNDVNGYLNITTSTITTSINYTKSLIDALLEDYPNCKIILNIPPFNAADKSGWASLNYTKYLDYSYYHYNINLRLYAQMLLDAFDGGVYSNKVWVVYSGLWVDRTYGFTTATRAISSRVTGTNESYYTDGIHPNSSGYQQIADAIYSVIRGIINY